MAWLWRDRPGGGDATCSISSFHFTVVKSETPVSQRHRRATTMRDPGDAATLSNVTPWSLGHSDSEYCLPERRHSRLAAPGYHPAALVNLEQFSAPKKHAENSRARVLRRRRPADGPETLDTSAFLTNPEAPQLSAISGDLTARQRAACLQGGVWFWSYEAGFAKNCTRGGSDQPLGQI